MAIKPYEPLEEFLNRSSRVYEHPLVPGPPAPVQATQNRSSRVYQQPVIPGAITYSLYVNNAEIVGSMCQPVMFNMAFGDWEPE